ncbi:MAG: hypothetical protein LBE31_09420 [Deltaproteobacteria bacterium]|jgi:DNA polymerase|nr:hypothetical protein [Deltaproteobacteria bacterium]
MSADQSPPPNEHESPPQNHAPGDFTLNSEQLKDYEPFSGSLSEVTPLVTETLSFLEYLRDLDFSYLVVPPTVVKTKKTSDIKPKDDFQDNSPPPINQKEAAEPHWARGAKRAAARSANNLNAPQYIESFDRALPNDPPKTSASNQAWFKQAENLEQLYTSLADCKLCPLSQGGKVKPLPGKGQAGSSIMIVIEPPDKNNTEADLISALLNDIITLGLKLKPEDCFITSLVKCPVEDPEDPKSINLKPCTSIVMREIELVDPLAVIALGLMPGRALSASNQAIGLLRHKKLILGPNEAKLLVTFGLRLMQNDPIIKQEFWQDLKRFFLKL